MTFFSFHFVSSWFLSIDVFNFYHLKRKQLKIKTMSYTELKSKLVDVDWSATGISATVQFRLTRSDAVAGVVLVTFVDGHVERDQERGSRLEYVK